VLSLREAQIEKATGHMTLPMFVQKTAEPVMSRTRTWSPAVAVVFVCGLVLASWEFATDVYQNGHFGDDQEYLTMTSSFVRHGSPAFQSGDDTSMLARLPKTWRMTLRKKFFPDRAPASYFPDQSGGFYGYHFFTYSAFVAPFRAALDGRPDAFRAHQYANLAIFSCALLSLLLLRGEPRLFWTIAPLAFFSPLLWFLRYAHTEPFVCSLGIAAVSCWLGGYPLIAILLTSIAATQYQPLVPLALLLAVHWLLSHRQALMTPATRWRSLPAAIACLAFAAVAFAPDVFYFRHYGTPNLIAREGFARLSLMSFDKCLWMFIDPNGGMLFFTPGILLLLVVAGVYATRRAMREREVFGVALLGTALLTLLASTCQRNWNHPTFGVSRYVLYAQPAILMFVAHELTLSRSRTLPRVTLFTTALALQLLPLLAYGVFDYQGPDAAHHTLPAQWLLSHAPALYSPPAEIFCERTRLGCTIDTLGRPRSEFLPAIWSDARGEPRKILTEDCDAERVLHAHHWSADQSQKISHALRSCTHGPFYVNL
jgi:hypothetical protein